jgi:hypothetical protein
MLQGQHMSPLTHTLLESVQNVQDTLSDTAPQNVKQYVEMKCKMGQQAQGLDTGS